MYGKEEMINKVKEQFSKDFGCSIEDLNKNENVIEETKLKSGRRMLESEGCFFKMISFQGKLIVSASKEIIPWCNEKLKEASGTWIAEYYILRAIDKELNEHGHEIADIHEYFLPDVTMEETKPLFNVKWYEKNELDKLKEDGRFDEAFAYDESCPDVLGVAAFDGEEIMGVAGASMDSEDMWQIGVNVVEEFKHKGVASNLVALIKDEILRRGKIPYCGTVQSHAFSKNTSIKAGFKPAWVEVYSD